MLIDLARGLKNVFLYKLFINSSGKQSTTCNTEERQDENAIDIVSIAFNNPWVIEQQIRLVKKNVLDLCIFAVADNSSDDTSRKQIYELCKASQTPYINVPMNPHKKRKCSDSHGVVLNWVYKHYIVKRKTAFFGFVDHDIFPIRPHHIIPNLIGKKVYGHLQTRDDKWYLWPGFCFFERSELINKKLDFRPEKNMDTGARNWSTLYKNINPSELIIPRQSYGKLRDGDCMQADGYEIIGDWLHTFNASHWMKVDSKDDLVEELLLQY
jgi:hypothetical protein